MRSLCKCGNDRKVLNSSVTKCSCSETYWSEQSVHHDLNDNKYVHFWGWPNVVMWIKSNRVSISINSIRVNLNVWPPHTNTVCWAKILSVATFQDSRRQCFFSCVREPGQRAVGTHRQQFVVRMLSNYHTIHYEKPTWTRYDMTHVARMNIGSNTNPTHGAMSCLWWGIFYQSRWNVYPIIRWWNPIGTVDVWIPTKHHEKEFRVFMCDRTWPWIQ